MDNPDELGLLLLAAAEKNICIKASKYTIDNLTADDIAQELRAKVWQSRLVYNPLKSGINTFTNFIIRNTLYDLFKYSKRKKRYIGDTDMSKLEIPDKNWEFNFYKNFKKSGQKVDKLWKNVLKR